MNQRFFNEKHNSPEGIWKLYHIHLEETLSLTIWEDKDFQGTPKERETLAWWNFKFNKMNVVSYHTCAPNPSPKIWHPPLQHHYKFNLDGASRGNLGEAHIKGVISNHSSEIIRLCKGYIGYESNNAVELENLIQGLRTTQINKLFPLIVEGDSKIKPSISSMAHLLQVFHQLDIVA